MKAVEDKEAEIEILQSQIDETENIIKALDNDLADNTDKIEEQKEYLSELQNGIEKAKSRLDRYQKCNTTVEAATKELQKEYGEIAKSVEPVKSLLGTDTDMVKVPKSTWKKVFETFKQTKTVETVTAFYEELIRKRDTVIDNLKSSISEADKYKRLVEEYLKNEGRYEDFEDYRHNRIARKLEYNERESTRHILTK